MTLVVLAVAVVVVSIDTMIVAVATVGDVMTIAVALDTTPMTAASTVADVTVKKGMGLETLIVTQALDAMTAMEAAVTTDVAVVVVVATTIATMTAAVMTLPLVETNLVNLTVGVVEITPLAMIAMRDKLGLSRARGSVRQSMSTLTFSFSKFRGSASCIPPIDSTPVFQKSLSTMS